MSLYATSLVAAINPVFWQSPELSAFVDWAPEIVDVVTEEVDMSEGDVISDRVVDISEEVVDSAVSSQLGFSDPTPLDPWQTDPKRL